MKHLRFFSTLHRKFTIKRFMFLFVLFSFFISINLIIGFKLFNRIFRIASTKQILKEIENNANTYQQFSQSSTPFVLGEYTAKPEVADARSANLKNFFRRYNSDLYDEAEFIVAISDKYGFDYRLIPAIAMQESNLCKYAPLDSYNCWGWGIYGTKVTRFESYEEAIDTVARGLKRDYLDHGLVTASDIMQKYTPSSNGSWAHGVNTFLKVLQ